MSSLLVKPQIVPPLDEGFRPASLANRAFRRAATESGESCPLVIALERDEGAISRHETVAFGGKRAGSGENFLHAERLLKTLLWQRGGWRVIVGGPREVGEHLKAAYAPGGARAFDANFMGGVYEHPFTVEVCDPSEVPPARERRVQVGGHLEGCRIGFDAGASDHKVAAVKDGEVVFSEETIWAPRTEKDPSYHFREIDGALRRAAEHLPRVDAIGVSAAGIYLNNQVKVASLFRGVPPDVFESRVKNLFLDIQRQWGGVPLEVVNDGEVTALAGAMTLEDKPVLGIAMGSSEAGGYVDGDGNITGWLNELAFVPVDFSPTAPMDEWSGDRGCGSAYFSQVAVIRLAAAAGIELDAGQTPAERLKQVQDLLASGDGRARKILETIGCYLGYAVAHYADLYDLRHVLVLGRVTSGEGGHIIVERAAAVLRQEFPDLCDRVLLHLPDESSRRVGQAVAAASLPEARPA